MVGKLRVDFFENSVVRLALNKLGAEEKCEIEILNKKSGKEEHIEVNDVEEAYDRFKELVIWYREEAAK